MAFNNKNNRITVKGFLSSELKEIPNASFALTFMIKVPRNSEKKKRVIYDEFTIYVCDIKNATLAKTNLTTGVSVKVTGELRVWHDGTYKICANDIQPIW
ncbi:hypothetical protein [uncultured Ruminococcus sp.]|uniref:hypothetical protein n=1 Tax=uncultured Ruminococcus sp. TaxID=165186 RepID=UPI0015B43A9F|nr:hypothetical protein [uncultured Ruminococcus sp.]